MSLAPANIRDINTLGVSFGGRSVQIRSDTTRCARMLAPPVPVARHCIDKAHGARVVVATRSGWVDEGWLIVTGTHVELGQVLDGVPCRHRIPFDDVVACDIYEAIRDTWSDDPTKREAPYGL